MLQPLAQNMVTYKSQTHSKPTNKAQPKYEATNKQSHAHHHEALPKHPATHNSDMEQHHPTQLTRATRMSNSDAAPMQIEGKQQQRRYGAIAQERFGFWVV